jgi:hypothetical protein
MSKYKFWSKQALDAVVSAAGATEATAAAVAAAAAEEKALVTEITLGTNTNTGFVVAPIAGTVTAIYSVINGVMTTADETLSFAVSGGTTMGDIVIDQASAAAGIVDTLAPSANNVVAAGDTIDVTTDGANGTTSTVAKITVLVVG